MVHVGLFNSENCGITNTYSTICQMYHENRVVVKMGWLGIRIMCHSGATCLSADCCFSELAL